MSIKLTNARKEFNSVGLLLKQGKILPAAMAFYNGLKIYFKNRNGLLKNEKKEFTSLIDKNLSSLNNCSKVREVFPLLLVLEPGKENELLKTVHELVSALESDTVDNAKLSLEEMEKDKRQSLFNANNHLKGKETKKADSIFERLVNDYKEDFDLKINIVDLFIEAKEYHKAIDYLKTAYKDNPKSVHIYNRLGMALRKIGRFEDSEKAYKQAISLQKEDEYLHFNLARLYLDMKNWDKAMCSAKQAVKINPGFMQAQKMVIFIDKNKC